MFPTMIKPRKIHNSKSVLVKATMRFTCFWCNFQEMKQAFEKHCFRPGFVSLLWNNSAQGINLVNDKHETCPNYKLAEEISYIETVLTNLGGQWCCAWHNVKIIKFLWNFASERLPLFAQKPIILPTQFLTLCLELHCLSGLCNKTWW